MKKIYFLYLLSCLSPSFAFSQSWDSLGSRINTDANDGPDVVYADSNYLYMAGKFKFIDGMHIQGIGRWNGVKWDSMGAGIDGLVYDSASELGVNPNNTWAITTYQNKLYVGGAFSSLGKVNAPGIGTWNGTTWDSIPINPFVGQLGAVVGMAVINNKLYVGGAFDTVAGFPCIGIACWNGSNWSSLNFPTLADFEQIAAICEYNGSIYTGGIFNNLPNDTLSWNILRWNGVVWQTVGGGVKGGLVCIWSMVVYNGELYVAGLFSKSEGNVGNYIQRWNGTSWNDVGGGTNAQVENLLVYHNKLYAMGAFSEAGGIPASNIAEWDGTKWCSLGSTFNNVVNSSCIYKDSLYIGGSFGTIDGNTITYVAEWTGGNYTDGCGNDATGVNDIKVDNGVIDVYPNPIFQNITVQMNLQNQQEVQFKIYNLVGELVYSENVNEPEGIITKQIGLSNLPSGNYIIQAITPDKVYYQKITKLQ